MVVGYTQGTYDIFHRGHLNLLKHAKERCDKLIVGVNSDRLVKEYKRKSTVYLEDDRVAIIKSLDFVDEVVLCDSLDKMEKWKKYKFNKVFIGDDWKGNARWETTKKDLAKVGVEVVFLPHTEGISTSMIREKLNLGNRIVDVSVIMPMYNAGEGVEKTISKLLREMTDEMELIVIDDCSTDNSYDICSKIQDQRMRLYRNKKNMGISATRNIGIDRALGEYIMFCDDDDEIVDGFIRKQLSIMEKNKNVNMVKCGRKLVCIGDDGNVVEEESTESKKTGLMDSVNKYKEYFPIRESKIFTNVWNGMYRKKVLRKNNIRFDESMKYGSEDADFVLSVFLADGDLYILPNIYYIHFKRSSSSTSCKFSKNKIKSLIKTAEKEKLIWNKVDLKKEGNAHMYIHAINGYYNRIMIEQVFHKDSTIKYGERKKIYKEFREKIMDDYCAKGALKYFRHNNTKQYLTTKILRSNCYFIIDVYYKIAARRINRNWRSK